jgi:hypothetical protein
LKQCLAFEIPAVSAVYRAAENYTGACESEGLFGWIASASAETAVNKSAITRGPL